MPGVFTAGWIKRGANGLIASNVFDAQETVASILADWDRFVEEGQHKKGCVVDILEERGINYIDWNGWLTLKAEEERRGDQRGKIAEKLNNIDEMLSVAKRE
ncbi:MAG: hypothetical protein ACXV2C_07400 [Candidatus Bathyarchaeia archaeon]